MLYNFNLCFIFVIINLFFKKYLLFFNYHPNFIQDSQRVLYATPKYIIILCVNSLNVFATPFGWSNN